MLGKYSKAILGGLSLLATWFTTATLDGSISNIEWFGLGGVLIGTAIIIAGPANTTGGGKRL